MSFLDVHLENVEELEAFKTKAASELFIGAESRSRRLFVIDFQVRVML